MNIFINDYICIWLLTKRLVAKNKHQYLMDFDGNKTLFIRSNLFKWRNINHNGFGARRQMDRVLVRTINGYWRLWCFRRVFQTSDRQWPLNGADTAQRRNENISITEWPSNFARIMYAEAEKFASNFENLFFFF